MPRVNTVKKSRKEYKTYDGKTIPVGSTYFWWKFRYGGIIRSLTYPKRSQLTRSSFLIQLYEIEDAIGALRANPDLEGDLENIKADIEMLRDECQENFDNMPDALQDTSDSGILLSERIEALDGWLSDLESIDIENEHVGADLDNYESELAEEYEDRYESREQALEDLRQDAEDERWEEILQEIQGTESGL